MYRVVFNDNRELYVEEIDIHELEQEAGPDGWFYIEQMYPEVPEELEGGEQQDGPLPAVP